MATLDGLQAVVLNKIETDSLSLGIVKLYTKNTSMDGIVPFCQLQRLVNCTEFRLCIFEFSSTTHKQEACKKEASEFVGLWS